MVRPDDRAIDHLHGIAATAVGESFQHQVPQPADCPAAKLLMHGVPVAQLLGQVAPGCAGARDPENRIQRAAVVQWRAAVRLTDKRLEKRPFHVAQKASDHS